MYCLAEEVQVKLPFLALIHPALVVIPLTVSLQALQVSPVCCRSLEFRWQKTFSKMQGWLRLTGQLWLAILSSDYHDLGKLNRDSTSSTRHEVKRVTSQLLRSLGMGVLSYCQVFAARPTSQGQGSKPESRTGPQPKVQKKLDLWCLWCGLP